ARQQKTADRPLGFMAGVLEAEPRLERDQPCEVLCLAGDPVRDSLQNLGALVAIEVAPCRPCLVERAIDGVCVEDGSPADDLAGEGVRHIERAIAPCGLARHDAGGLVWRIDDHAAAPSVSRWMSAFVAFPARMRRPSASGDSESSTGTCCSCRPPCERSGPRSAERSCDA